MKAIILHDEKGEIIAISKIGDLRAAGSKFTKVGMTPGPGQEMIEVELSPEQERRPMSELHEQFRVEVRAKTLVKR